MKETCDGEGCDKGPMDEWMGAYDLPPLIADGERPHLCASCYTEMITEFTEVEV